jgi:hypothetical protein
MENNNLQHAGIKGMKWGVRRYQNKDGSLTPAGQKRYARDTRDLSETKKKNYKPDTDKWVKDDISASRRIADESYNLTTKLRSANGNAARNRKRPKMDLKNMSEEQMRREINRAILEKQYSDMFSPQKESKGRKYVDSILGAAGTTLAITSSALGIALAIKELRGG